MPKSTAAPQPLPPGTGARGRARADGKPSARDRILAAARSLLEGAVGSAEFSIDAVAREAGVTRMTVYYQFGGKPGLLEAIYDDIAARGEIGERLPLAFQQSTLEASIDALVAAFAHFWASERTIIRRIRHIGALDPELAQSHGSRDQRRLEALRAVFARWNPAGGRRAATTTERKAELIYALTSFEVYDVLASQGRSEREITKDLQHLARAAAGLSTG
jgi:AcrR family transcriptional regulator